MSQIIVQNLTFSYDSSFDNIFEEVSFQIDTDWKLGFIGRNGKGKTTFLNLLQDKYEYKGNITKSVEVEYFPFTVQNQTETTLEVLKGIIAPYTEWERKMEQCLEEETAESLDEYNNILNEFMIHDGYIIEELIEKEIWKLKVDSSVLKRPFQTLSFGERTKVLLAALFLKKNNFLLIDEPTNHLDQSGRDIVMKYLDGKSGFILVSHDRDFLDHIVDHILSINKSDMEIVNGNFSIWQENRDRQDAFELAQDTKLKKDINKLEKAFKRTAGWSDEVEKSKIGTHSADRGAIGHKAAKMMKRAKSIESRKLDNIEEKSKLLKNIEQPDQLKMNLLKYPKERMMDICDISLSYREEPLLSHVSFEINQGDRIALKGENGSGKSSILKVILNQLEQRNGIQYEEKGRTYEMPNIDSGNIRLGSQLVISYVPQDTSFLIGSLSDYAEANNLDDSLFKMALRKLDLDRKQFDKNMEEFSEGQKKKVLLAKSLIEPSHIFIWDEPLNFVDILSRIQLEQLILEFKPTMIFVEHDTVFNQKIATKIIDL